MYNYVIFCLLLHQLILYCEQQWPDYFTKVPQLTLAIKAALWVHLNQSCIFRPTTILRWVEHSQVCWISDSYLHAWTGLFKGDPGKETSQEHKIGLEWKEKKKNQNQKNVGWVLLSIHTNRRFIRDGSPGRPPRLSHSSWTLKVKKKRKDFQLSKYVCECCHLVLLAVVGLWCHEQGWQTLQKRNCREPPIPGKLHGFLWMLSSPVSFL